MSRASRRLKREQRKAMRDKNMLERMAELAKRPGQNDNSSQQVQVSPQLPIHYGGSGNSRRNSQVGDYNDSSWRGHQGWRGQDDHKPVIYSSKPAEEETVFRCESEDIEKACPIATPPRIYFQRKVWNMFMQLAEDFDTEWIALLRGKYDEQDRRWNITGYYFPPQVVTGGHVDVDEDFVPLPGTIGALHSHVRMAVFFSGEDIRHSNWPVEIVVNASEEYKAMVRYKLECGKWAKHYTECWLEGDNAPAAVSDKLRAAIAAGVMADTKRNSNKVGYRPIHSGPAVAGVPQVPETVQQIRDAEDKGEPTQPLEGEIVLTPQGSDDGSAAAADIPDDDKADAQEMQRRMDAEIDLMYEECSECGGLGSAMGQNCSKCNGSGMMRVANGKQEQLSENEQAIADAIRAGYIE